MMKMQDIRAKDTAALRALLRTLVGELRAVRFGIKMRQEKNVARHRQLRRTIARGQTELRARANSEKKA